MVRPMPTRPPIAWTRRILWAAAAGAVAAVLGLVVWAGGCAGPLPAARVDSSKVVFHLDEYRIVPTTVHVRAGRIKIVAVNTGLLVHNLRIAARSGDGNGNPAVVLTTPTAHPGQTVFVKGVLAPGTYDMTCTLGNHADLGQRGTLIAR